jgi:hypothetical protein
VEKFKSFDEAIKDYTNQIQAYSLALASKAPSLVAVSSTAETAGHKNEQPEPCGKPAPSVPVKTVAFIEKKTPAAMSANDPSFKKPSETKEKHLEMLQKMISGKSKKATNTIKSFLCSSVLTRRILSLLLIFRMPRVKFTGSSNQSSFPLWLNPLLISFQD